MDRVIEDPDDLADEDEARAGSSDAVRAYYDRYGDQERGRLVERVRGRVSFEVHKGFLTTFVGPGARVLEIGAGPARFTKVLAQLGARVVVTDLSPVQLSLNEHYLSGMPEEAAVERRELLDICDTSEFADGEFDVVLAFGGPLSYAFERVDEAMAGLLRITADSGFVLASVMSLLGSWRHYLPAVTARAAVIGEDVNDRIFATGDLRHDPASEHICRMFRAREARELVERNGGTWVAASASNWGSLADEETVLALEADPERWRHFVGNEIRACAEPGALDGGTHILFAATPRRFS